MGKQGDFIWDAQVAIAITSHAQVHVGKHTVCGLLIVIKFVNA